MKLQKGVLGTVHIEFALNLGNGLLLKQDDPILGQTLP